MPAELWLFLVALAALLGISAGHALGRAAGWRECERHVRAELRAKFAPWVDPDAEEE